jgi:uncharacterized protein
MFPQSHTSAAPVSLPANHPIRVMMEEHEIILRVLDRLERAALAAQRDGNLDPRAPELAIVGEIADMLLAAEPHHQREEQALFPRLEDAGVEGPPHVMRIEHVALREAKHELQALAAAAATTDPQAFRERLVGIAGYLVPELRAHIQKENQILYPMALEVLSADAWREVERECDRIGPCAFHRA